MSFALVADDPIAPGALIADRFQLERLVGSGGMGTVWRAHDRVRGELVALKLTEDPGGDDIPWSEREGRALRALRHPAVPRYVAHGLSEGGIHYIAIEWLDGEDLGARLERGPLSVEESLALAGEIAGALTAVHAAGVVHCDIKPSNIFLVGGELTSVMLMDFGIARLPHDEEQVQGGVVGTPSYMAPEQTFGSEHIDARSDLYALGGVLFECLTGRRPFTAANTMAALTKAIFEVAPLASDFVPGLPRGVDALVADLLAKDKAKRPQSAADVAHEVGVLLSSAGWRGTRSATLRLTRVERRLISVVLAVATRPGEPLIRALDPHSTLSVAPKRASRPPDLGHLAERSSAELKVLGDGSIAAVLGGAGAPTDVAAGAARYALALHGLVPDLRMAVVTGWQEITGIQPVGQVIDRATRLLQSADPAAAGAVLLDAMTAALLGDRFPVSGDGDVLSLSEEREPEARVPLLLGKPSPCVGRERELAALEGMIGQAASLPTARAVLLTAGPGTGKSRVLGELLRRLHGRAGVEVLTAYGDPTQQKAPFGMLARAVRRSAGVLDGEPEELRRQKLAARVARSVPRSIQRRVAEFLGEMVGTSFPAEQSVQLRAARREPMLMGDQMRRAWVDFLESECAERTVVLLLEDLHWADRPTIDFIDTALRLLEDRPLLVFASARPEVDEALPKLWAGRHVTRIVLPELPRGACEELVRATLGDAVPQDEVARIVERSAHNAFFLEELVRAVAERRGDELPATVLAMMQSRLESLDPEGRRTLRAGSVFGGHFWRGAVASLLGVPPDSPRLAEQLAELEQKEWITRLAASRFRREAEYEFRHSLVREASYGLLTDDDRALGHRLAAAWLEQAGEKNAMVLAEHLDDGGEQDKAALQYCIAARQALEANDLSAAIARADRAFACGVAGAALGEASLVRAEAHRWQGRFDEGARWAQRALDVFMRGGESWFNALREALASLVSAGDMERLLAIADLLDELWAGPEDASGAQVMAMSWMAIRLFALALNERAESFHERASQVEERFAAEPAVHACIAMTRAMREGYLVGDMSSFAAALQSAVERFERTGDLRSASLMRVNIGHAYNELGVYGENMELLRALIADAQRLGLAHVEASARCHLGKTLLALGQIEPARAEVVRAVSVFHEQGEQRLEGVAYAYLAHILRKGGDLEGAALEASRAVDLLRPLPTLRSFPLACLAAVRLAQGDARAALEAAREAIVSVDQAEEGEVFTRLVYAEALERAGEREAARAAIAEARTRLRERADGIADPDRRRSFLEDEPENARTMELARIWVDVPDGSPGHSA